MIDTNAIGPFAKSQTKALNFITSLIVNAAVSETLKIMDTLHMEGIELIKEIKATDQGPKKEEYKLALKHHIKDSKLLLDTIMSNPIEKDV